MNHIQRIQTELRNYLHKNLKKLLLKTKEVMVLLKYQQQNKELFELTFPKQRNQINEIQRDREQIESKFDEYIIL